MGDCVFRVDYGLQSTDAEDGVAVETKLVTEKGVLVALYKFKILVCLMETAVGFRARLTGAHFRASKWATEM